MLTAADVMTTDVISVAPGTSIHDVAKLLYTRRISGVPVVDADGHVIGIVSEGDLIGHAETIGEQPVDEHRRSWWLTLFGDAKLARDYTKTHGRTAQDVMSSPVITVTEAATVAEIAKTLERNRIKRVPVVRGKQLVGIVTRASLLQALATGDVSKPVSFDDRTIRERLLAELKTQPWAYSPAKNIVVQNGVVHLWGFVKSEDERRALRVAAERAPGVVSVEDHLEELKIERWEPL